MRKLVVVLSLVAIVFALCASAAQAAPNLVVNGNFEAGNTGFTSAYTYSPGQLWPTTAYDVAANPNGDNSNFASFGDHTSGTGMMMVVNGATTSGVTLWSETVPVAANTSYQFEAWIRPMSAPANSQPNPGILEFSINQVSLGTGTTSVSGQWSSFNASWDSGGSRTAAITIVDQETEGYGNDFGLDDISLTTLASPPTVTGVEPTAGSRRGGTSVTITGANLTGATGVSFGGTPATNVSVNGDGTQVTCTSPAGSGTLEVTVNTPEGTSATSPGDQFGYDVYPYWDRTLYPLYPAPEADSWGFSYSECTSYVAWRLSLQGNEILWGSQYVPGGPWGTADAYTWTEHAINRGVKVDTDTATPGSLGAVICWDGMESTHPYGHVAMIDQVFGDGRIRISEYNGPLDHDFDQRIVNPSTAGEGAFHVLHFGTYVTPTVNSLSANSGSIVGGTSVIISGTGFTAYTAVAFGGLSATVTAADLVSEPETITVMAPPSAMAGTIQVKVTAAGGFSADTSADDFTYIAAPSCSRYDQTDIHIVKSGTWTNYTSASSSGGSYGRSSTALASATIYFTGTRLDWIAMKGTTTSKADVYVDGVKATGTTPVNLYSATAAYKVNVWSTGTLANGSHIVKIERSAASASGKYLTLDAVDIYGTIADPPVTKARYEQTNTLITKTGTWSNYTTASASGGSYGRSSTASASRTIKFVGTRLDYIAMKGTTTGYAEIWVDGVKLTGTTPINLYASPAVYQQTIYSTGTLAFGLHTVKIVRATASASGKYLTLDAFDVWGWISS